MLHFVNTKEGICSLKGIRFNVNKRFPAGAYTITCKDVTKGLPSRMLMKTVKVLMKIVDLTEPEQPEEVKPASKKPEPKKGGKK